MASEPEPDLGREWGEGVRCSQEWEAGSCPEPPHAEGTDTVMMVHNDVVTVPPFVGSSISQPRLHGRIPSGGSFFFFFF